ncbi:hypothetical protein K456DRAFT_51956 [Colletotrichum gloeosporioides 23]|nr:hypothetical protein K456DRAFT_51956 [Colletotrichum gloeosporioides 23]
MPSEFRLNKPYHLPPSPALATYYPDLPIHHLALQRRDCTCTMFAGGVTFQLKLIIAVITATFATQETRHAWASPASLVCLLLWIVITTGLVL